MSVKDLTGILEAYGTEIPRTDSGQYLGLSRDGWVPGNSAMNRTESLRSGRVEYGSDDFLALFGVGASDHFYKPKPKIAFRAPLRGDKGAVRQ